MSKDSYIPKKLNFQFQINDGKIFVKPFDDYTNQFLRKTWHQIVNELFDQTQIEKINQDFILFKQTFLFKDLKNFKQTLENKFHSIRYCSSFEVYKRGILSTIEKVFSIKITVPGIDKKEEKKTYKDFIICYETREIPNFQSQENSISFGTSDPNTEHKLGRRPHIKSGRNRFFAKDDEIELRFPKIEFIIFYTHQHHSKIKQVLSNLEQNRQEWLLYPMNPYLDTFSMDKIYYEELIQKILVKKTSQIYKIVEKFDLQMVDTKIKVLKDDAINRSSSEPEHPDLQEGYYLGFHVFGQAKQFYQFYIRINSFFQSRRMWVLRPYKICCCGSLADLEDYMKEKENLETYLIYDHIMVIVKSQEEVNKLTSIKYRQQMIKDNNLSEEQRLLQILQTGEFTLDTNDYDQQDLEYIYKERQRYKEYLERQHRVKVTYLPSSNKRKLYLLCEISAYRIFKGNVYCFINDFKSEKEQLRQFNTPFHVHMFDKYLRAELEVEFPEVKFVIKKKGKIDQVWAKFHAKDRAQFMQRLNETVKKFEFNFDYIVCKKQPLPQNWFALYRRPHILSIHTLTCRKYVISRDTKVYVQPYQSLSRPIDEMLYLIDHSFQNCWEFVEIAQQNDINLMSLFLQFQEKKTKKPDRIKAIPLSNHRYINKMLLWYNDMLKKIESRREQDIKKLYKRYEDKKEMHIMIPRHATHSILLNFVLPSFIKEFTQQTGYNLKEIFFYYPILFDEGHCYVESLTLKVIDDEMRKANIELQNQNYLTKDSIKKILQMEYLTLHCTFEGDQRIWKASNLSSYVFFIEREVIMQKKIKMSMKAKPQMQRQLLNFMVPLFFIDASFNREIVVDLVEEWFYTVGKVVVEGPFEIKSDKKYDQIAKCVNCIKKIFRSLSYVVLYVDKDFNVSKNGYYYSHKDFIQGQNLIHEPKQQQAQLEAKNFKKVKTKTQMTFNGPQYTQNTLMSITKSQHHFESFQQNNFKQPPQAKLPKIILYPMKLQLDTFNSNRSRNFDDSGKILKRESKRLIIEVIESEMSIWYMGETFKQKIPQLQQYLKNPNHYKNNQNNLLGDISEYSILDLNDEKEQSKFLNFQDDIKQNHNAKQQKQHLVNAQNDMSMGSIDLSVIYFGQYDKSMDKNNVSDKMSFLEQINTNELNDMSTYSTENL